MEQQNLTDRDESQLKVFEFYAGTLDIVLEPIERKGLDASTFRFIN